MRTFLWAATSIVTVLTSVLSSSPLINAFTLQAGGADVALRYGTVCDPGCGYLLSAYLDNHGPEDATGIVVTFDIPGDAPIDTLSVDSPCRITSPGTWHSGHVSIEIDTMPVGGEADIEVRCALPLNEGWQSDITFEVTTAASDPDPSNNALHLQLYVPHKPVVTQIRELSDPFRLEITGEQLFIRPFGSVVIGSCDGVLPRSFEDSPDGSKLVLLGGRQLRQLFPKGKAVQIQILNTEGGQLFTYYTRR